ncbi:helix-turn-helix domain-containing protein, partial [Streptomyces sp. NPDC048483]|uniref:TetR/AcrR family transcriptional regulator n=1 Tax=Streptomyces sp. NPDC048483 TaxID=3154927 RepID=UPI003433B4F0
MGNREDLLAGARRCLEEKGWARTTVRDIATAAGGVSMAAIGYHFGSREALLNAALIEAIDEWGTCIGRTLASFGESGSSPAGRYEAMWTAIIKSFQDDRTLWLHRCLARRQQPAGTGRSRRPRDRGAVPRPAADR